MNNYLPLIEFTITHNYYKNGRCKDSDLTLYKNQDKTIANYKLVFRKEEAGKYVLYIDSANNLEERLQFLIKDIAENKDVLSFLLTSANQYFTTFTKYVDIKSTNQLIKLSIPAGDEAILTYKLDTLPRTEGNTSFEKEILKKHPGALIYISLDTANTNSDVLLNKVKNFSPVKINIEFEAKSAYWKYIFLPRSNKSLDLSVVDTKQLINFTKIEWSEFINGQTAGISYSDKEIIFSEKYLFHFQLWKNYFNGKSLIIDQLPFPNPGHTGNSYHDTDNDYISIYQYF